jgi:hypothetical protein
MRPDPLWTLGYTYSLLMAACMGVRLAQGDVVAALVDFAIALVVPLSDWYTAGARLR